MARLPRIEFEGAWYHVMNRGLERRNIFIKDSHNELFLKLLSDISKKFSVEIHSYCLMGNHYHLLLQTRLPNLHRAMQYLNSVYTIKFNRDLGRDGPLFRGRYKAILIDKDSYLLNVSRYIHKNPSTANIVSDDRQYLWSSYKYYVLLNQVKKPEWLVTSEILNSFGNDSKKYLDFVEKKVDDDTEKFYSCDQIKYIFGKKSFIEMIADNFVKKSKRNSKGKQFSNEDKVRNLSINYPSLEQIFSIIVNKYKIEPTLLLENKSRSHKLERNILIYLFYLNPRYSLVEKGRFLGITGDAIVKSSARLLDKMKLSPKLLKEIDLIREEVYKISVGVGV